MVRAIAILAVCLPSLVGQQFEVASIKPNTDESGINSGINTGHGRLDGHNVTLKRCIMGAYGVGPHEISGGPEWMDSDRFEILAKADQPVGDAALMVMLQGLLADRFKLALHRETRTLSALVLEVGRNGPKLEKAESCESITNTSSSRAGMLIDARCTTMDSFAKVLARRMEMPVVNHTGLDGVFNLKLHWTPESIRPADSAGIEAPTVFTAIQEQLGLRIHAVKAPVEILVIDHVEKPSEN